MSQEKVSEDEKLDLSAEGVWQRLPGETPGAYSAFTTFLQLGPDATLDLVAEAVGRSPGAVRNLSSRHCWQERAAAWRQHLACIACAAAERATVQTCALWSARASAFREQQWEAAQQAAYAARYLLNKLVAQSDAKAAAYEIARLLEVSSKLGRLASHSALDKSTAAPAASDADDEFERALKKAYGPTACAGQHSTPDTVPSAVPPLNPQPSTLNPSK